MCPTVSPGRSGVSATGNLSSTVTGASGIGLATLASTERCWTPGSRRRSWATSTRREPAADGRLRRRPDLAGLAGPDLDRGTETVVLRTTIVDLKAPATDAHDVWLRLHLLSHRLVARTA